MGKRKRRNIITEGKLLRYTNLESMTHPFWKHEQEEEQQESKREKENGINYD